MDIEDRDRLVKAFNHMVDTVNKGVQEAEEALEPTIEEMVQNAKVLARELHALSQEEAESLGNALLRDMKKANTVLNQQGKELRDWLSFDLQLAEDRFIDMIARAADNTWLDFRQFEAEDHQASVYRSGEICTAGTLSCNHCGKRISLQESGQIPDCPECQHTEFYRVVS